MISNKKIIFIATVLSLVSISWIKLLLTHSSEVASYYCNDNTNTFMDYFNMLALLYYPDPYIFNANYPALCFLFFKIMYNALPLPVTDDYSNGFYLRNYMVAELGFIVIITGCLMMIITFLMIKINEDNTVVKRLIIISIIMSGPFIFAIERGNIILIAFTMTLGYSFLYNSEQKEIRYISYVMLAIASGIKIYPAVFGLLTIAQKNVELREKINLIIIGVVIFIIPFFFFNGFDSVADFINGFISTTDADWGLGNNYSFYALSGIIMSLFKIELKYNIVMVIIPIIFCLLMFRTDELWKKIYAMAIICIWIPHYSFTYTLIFMIIPLLFYLNDKSKNNVKYSLLFGIILSPLITPMATIVNDFLIGKQFPVSYGMMITNIIIFLMTVIIIKENISNIIRKKLNLIPNKK